jgi:hypothetical protein
MIKAEFGNWFVSCIPEDGARISSLKFDGHDLLTSVQGTFKIPQKNYGEYELRPVYGYDDCFPTVDTCKYPTENFECRDHGQLCWQSWKVKKEINKLICSTDCTRPKVTFIRTLEFDGNKLNWRFEVINNSKVPVVFLHVMHALMPLREIKGIKVGGFKKVVDEEKSIELNLKDSDDVNAFLLNLKPGSYKMLLLKEISHGFIDLDFINGIKLQINYDLKSFPLLGIWWNNEAYPDEDGLRRSECAFEPIPGTCSNLEKSYKDGTCLEVVPGKKLNWTIYWNIIK